MSNFIPLKTNVSPHHPVLLIDADSDYQDLHESAEYRLELAKGMLHSLSCMKTEHASGQDIINMAAAAHLLVADACDLFDAARRARYPKGGHHA